MKLSWLLFVFITVVYGAASYKLKAHTGQTEVFTIIFGPGLHQTFKNSSSDERKFLTSNKVDDVNSILTDDFDKTGSHPKPPSPDDASKMARFIVHYSLWGSLSHISHQPNTSGAPLARVYSISDGPIRASSGVPYFYLTPNDPELRDMIKDPKASLTLTLAQTPYCRMNSYDPEDPRCAQVILTGRLVVLKNYTLEWNKAQQALFSRHPVMRKWPESHHWVCCKLEIDNILVADNFGGNKYPSVEDYFRAQPDFCSLEDPLYQMAFY